MIEPLYCTQCGEEDCDCGGPDTGVEFCEVCGCGPDSDGCEYCREESYE
jgi:hypothetical protein